MPTIAAKGGTNARRRDRRPFSLAPLNVERDEAVLRGDMADMGMVDDDTVAPPSH